MRANLARLVVLGSQGPAVRHPAGGHDGDEMTQQPFAGTGHGGLHQVDGGAARDHASYKGQDHGGQGMRAVGFVHEGKVHQQIIH